MGGIFSSEDLRTTAHVTREMANAVIQVLEPSASLDKLNIERYSGSNQICVDLIQQDILKMNTQIQMEDLNIKELLLKALNSRTAFVFKYQWNHQEGEKKGQLRFFYLKIKNLDQVVGGSNVNLDIDLCFGARHFSLSSGTIPQAGSQKFLLDSQEAIQDASEKGKNIVVFPIQTYT